MRKIMLCTHWPLWRSPATEQYFRMQYDSEHYSHVIMSAMASQITGASIVYSNVCSGADQKHQSSASMAFMRGIRRWPANSPQKGPVTRKMFPSDDVIMSCICWPTAAGIGLVNDKHLWQKPWISLKNITKSIFCRSATKSILWKTWRQIQIEIVYFWHYTLYTKHRDRAPGQMYENW